MGRRVEAVRRVHPPHLFYFNDYLYFHQLRFFTKALRVIDVSTGYAIFTGIGAVGTAIIGMTFLGDGGGVGKVFFIVLLIIGILGLKMSETTTEEIGQEG
nr:PsmrA [uncultured bacterium]